MMISSKSATAAGEQRLMTHSEFPKYALALMDGDKIIHTASGAGLLPLWECLEKFRDSRGQFTLFDKVVGLAAARLMV
jgi:hypothetical protein